MQSNGTGGSPRAIVAQEMLAPALLHEMRQPLTGLKAALQLVARQGGEVLEKLEDWELIVTQVARLEEMFATYQDLLEPKRLEPRPFRVATVVERAVKLAAHLLRPLGQRFSLDISTDVPPALGAPSALLHTLLNVVRNAADALEQAGSSGRLAIRVLRVPGAAREVQVRVSDEGTGVVAADRDHIFALHFSTKTPGYGSGIGLYVSRQMLAAADGTIDLVPEEDPARLQWARTELRVAFRVATGEHAATDTLPETLVGRATMQDRSKSNTARGGGSISSPSARVLVVDDERVMVAVLTMAISRAGHRVDSAQNGEEAIERLKKERYDLLLVDKNMPGINGVEVVRAARSVAPQMGILLMTAYASTESATELLPLRIDAYITKPFELEDFMQQVEEILQRRAARGSTAPVAPAKRAAADAAADTAASKDVIVVEHDGSCRQQIMQSLTGLGLSPHLYRDPAAGLRALPEAAGAVVAHDLCDNSANSSLRNQRIASDSFRLVMLTDRASLDSNVLGILLGARAVLQRSADRMHIHTTLRQVFGGASAASHVAGGQTNKGRTNE